MPHCIRCNFEHHRRERQFMEEIQFKQPELEDKQIIDHYFKTYPSRSCERTFVNTLLWSRAYHVTYAIIEDTLVFRSEGEKIAFTYPTGQKEQVKKALDVLMSYVKQQAIPFYLYGVTVSEFEQINEWYPDRFEIEYNRDIADYVYESEKLITLSGKKLHGKRNHINKFKATYENWSYEEMNEGNIDECFDMAMKWRRDNSVDENADKRAEMCVALNSLRLFRELELIGGVLRVNGEVVAFTIGEPVSPDTFVVHIEKAYAEIQGAYPMINQQFVEHACSQYQYINREEDTGAEGLRKAKLSYRPVFLIEKGMVKERES